MPAATCFSWGPGRSTQCRISSGSTDCAEYCCYSFECRDCGEWHIEEGDAVVGRLAHLERFRQLSHVGGDAAGSA